jgi:hypothetical protein
VALLCISGMFIEGMAGIVNAAVTVASLTGAPSFFAVTSKVLSPDVGGSDSMSACRQMLASRLA